MVLNKLLKTKMKSVYWLMLNLLIQKVMSKGSILLDPLASKILKEIKPDHVTIFVSELLAKHHIHQEISLIQKFPNNLFFLKNVDDKNYTFSLKKSNIDSSLVVLYTELLNDTKLLTDLLVRLVPLNQRPKCLVILVFHNTNFQKEIKNILRYAWKNKILDFTILNANDYRSPIKFYSYNPFKKYFYNNELEIFPNKFREIKNHTVKVGVVRANIFDKAEFLFVKKVNHFYISFLVKMMKFNLEFIEICPEKKIEYYDPEKKHLWFDQTVANLLNEVIVVTDSLKKLVVFHSGQKCRAVVAVVPRLYKSQSNFSFEVWFLALLMPSGIILCLIYSMKILKFTKEPFEIFYSIRILLGQTVKKLPGKNTSRIIYLTVVMLSNRVLNNFYSGIMDLSLGQEEIEYHSFEDLDESGLLLFTPMINIEYIYSGADSRSIQNLKKKTGYMVDCMEELKKTRNHVCIEWEYNALVFEKKYRINQKS